MSLMASSCALVLWLGKNWPVLLLVGLLLMPMIVGLLDVIRLGISVTGVIGDAVVNASMNSLCISLAGAFAIYRVTVVWRTLLAAMNLTSVGIGLLLLAVIRGVRTECGPFLDGKKNQTM